ncbi:MAG: SDR family NAD(P)-dependent oxidoreductase [Armatimonadota bacterium]
MLLEGKVALVTGGGRGIGAGIVRALAREGASVAINCSKSNDLAETLASDICEQGGNAISYCCDIRDADAVKVMVDAVYSDFGRIDAVINNAIGGTQNGALDDVTWDDYTNAFDYAVKAVLNTVHAVRPIMREQGGGRIINIVTELWNSAPTGWTVYVSGKGAMVGLSRTLAAELGPENITVNMVAPGWMKDEKVTDDIDTSGYAISVPLRRQGDAEEIGNACAFLMSHLAGFVSGAYIPVCGGNVRQTGC